LLLELHMLAVETIPDVSTAEDWWYPLLPRRTPSGASIEDVIGTQSRYIYFRDTDHAYWTEAGDAFGAFRVMGDTEGSDICNTTPTDTHMFFEIRSVTVRIGPP